MQRLDDWKVTSIRPGASVREALERIDAGGVRIALVVDEGGGLTGIVTDGDLRRGLLRNVSFDAPVEQIMNPQPVVASESDERGELLEVMTKHDLVLLPILDQSGKVVGLESIHHLLETRERDNWVVILAGGLGSRLRPITKDTPKPLVDIGGRPVMENIIQQLAAEGFRRFFLSVNYRASMIQKHFGDGSRLGVEICYLPEETPLGTAGPLALLPSPPEHPLLVMNGDIVTNVKFDSLLRFHRESGADATVCVREYDFEVPYGTVMTKGGLVRDIVEKPIQRFLIVAGIYLLSQGILELVPSGATMDMPDLLRLAIADGKTVSVFPIHEYWLDIGRKPDLDQARADFHRLNSK